MGLKLTVSAAVVSLLFTAPAFAEEVAPSPSPEMQEARKARREARMLRKLERVERKLNRAVEHGRLSRAQADGFLAEARQLHADVQAQRQASGGQLTEEQRQQFKERTQALRERVRAAVQATQPQPQQAP
jgi:FtsZ-binding cell division protein ZapB